MANSSARQRKRVKKNVVDGVAHVHASFNNTIVTITDRQGMPCHGPPQAVAVSVVLVKAPFCCSGSS